MSPTSDPSQQGRLHELSERDCWARLAEHEVGRLAYVQGDGPTIVPLNYLAQDGKVWLRTASYNQLAVHVAGQLAAFEVDDINVHDRTGFSVLLRGRVEHVLHTMTGLTWPEPTLWPDGIRTMMFCLTPTQVTGRSLAQADVTPAPGRGPGSIQRSQPATRG
jgi:hypothetical protein